MFEQLPTELLTTHVIPLMDIKSKFNFGFVCMQYYQYIAKYLEEYRESMIPEALEELKDQISSIDLPECINLDKKIIKDFYRKESKKYDDITKFINIESSPIFRDGHDKEWTNSSNENVFKDKRCVLKDKVKTVIFINKNGFNDDKRSHRADDFNDIDNIYDFDANYFNPKYKINIANKPLTWGDIALGLYMVKGSKMDFWYELYCGLTRLDLKGDVLYIYPAFDHGS